MAHNQDEPEEKIDFTSTGEAPDYISIAGMHWGLSGCWIK